MSTTTSSSITVETTVNAPAEKVWQFWTGPVHITKWNNASPDWHTPRAENDIKPGGRFNYRMEAKDGSFGFDFSGVYDVVKPYEIIEYTIDDGRKVKITFKDDGQHTHITENFETETINSVELQRTGWQALLNNFKQYAETN